MSVIRIKNDMQHFEIMLNETISNCTRLTSVLSGIDKSNCLAVILPSRMLIASINRLSRLRGTLYSETSFELDKFFFKYNSRLLTQRVYDTGVRGSINSLISLTNTLWGLYLFDIAIGGILEYGIDEHDLRNYIPKINVYKNQLLELKTMTFYNNHKLILKVR